MGNKYDNGRCPRCAGYLYSAIFTARSYSERAVLREKYVCMNCGRRWELEDGRMKIWPDRVKFSNRIQGGIVC